MTVLTQPVDPRVSLNGVYHWDASLEDDVELCRQTGITQLGVLNRKVDRVGLRAAVTIVQDAAIGVSTVCHPSAFTLADPDRWPAELADAKRSVDYAVALGSPTVYTTTGPRGALSWDRAAEAFVDAARDWASYAHERSVRLLVEPTTHYASAISMIHTLGDLVSVTTAAGIGVCLDVYGCWYDSTFRSCLDSAASVCGLVQVSDYVLGERHSRVRAVPGDGIIEWDAVFAALAAHSYAGAFDIELLGSRVEAEGMVPAFSRAAAWLTARLAGYPQETQPS
jgi:sugar phosphate isomerase/epimerase